MMSPPLEVKCKPYPEDTGSTRTLPAFPSFSPHKTSNLPTSPKQECFPITQEEAKKKRNIWNCLLKIVSSHIHL